MNNSQEICHGMVLIWLQSACGLGIPYSLLLLELLCPLSGDQYPGGNNSVWLCSPQISLTSSLVTTFSFLSNLSSVIGPFPFCPLAFSHTHSVHIVHISHLIPWIWQAEMFSLDTASLSLLKLIRPSIVGLPFLDVSPTPSGQHLVQLSTSGKTIAK